MPTATLDQQTLALLKADLRRVSRLLEESDETLAYHDKKREGLQSANNLYRLHKAEVEAKLNPKPTP